MAGSSATCASEEMGAGAACSGEGCRRVGLKGAIRSTLVATRTTLCLTSSESSLSGSYYHYLELYVLRL